MYSSFQPSKRYAMSKNLTIGFPPRGVVLCDGNSGFHKGCTDEPDENYDVIANHNNWGRAEGLQLLRICRKGFAL